MGSAILAKAGERRLMMCDDGGGVLELLESSKWCCCVCVCGHGKRGIEVRGFSRERDSAEKRERVEVSERRKWGLGVGERERNVRSVEGCHVAAWEGFEIQI